MIEKAFYLSREQTLSIIRGNPNLKKFYFIPRWIHHLCDWIDILSSPDPLGQVSYCHHWAIKISSPFFLFLAWWPSWLEVGITGHNFGRGASKDHSAKVWLPLAQWFLRRRFLCEFPIRFYVKLVVPFQKCVHQSRPVSKMAAITKNRNFFKWPKLLYFKPESAQIWTV
jgi:hypothetical protein